jgi:hypothetical protein
VPHRVGSYLVSLLTRSVNSVRGFVLECIRAAPECMTGVARYIARLTLAAKNLGSFINTTYATRIAPLGPRLRSFATWLGKAATFVASGIWTFCVYLGLLLFNAWVASQASRVSSSASGTKSLDSDNLPLVEPAASSGTQSVEGGASVDVGRDSSDGHPSGNVAQRAPSRMSQHSSSSPPRSTKGDASMDTDQNSSDGRPGSSAVQRAPRKGRANLSSRPPRSTKGDASMDTDQDNSDGHSSSSMVQRALRKVSQDMHSIRSRPRESGSTSANDAETETQSLLDHSTSERANWSRRSGSSYAGSTSGNDSSWDPSNEMDRSGDSNDTVVNDERARRRVPNCTPLPLPGNRRYQANRHNAQTPGEDAEDSHDSDDSAPSSPASSPRASSGSANGHSLTDMDIETPPKLGIPPIDSDDGDSPAEIDSDGSEEGQSRYISLGGSDDEPDFSKQPWCSSPSKRAKPLSPLTESILPDPSPQDRRDANVRGLPVQCLGPEFKKHIDAEIARRKANCKESPPSSKTTSEGTSSQPGTSSTIATEGITSQLEAASHTTAEGTPDEPMSQHASRHSLTNPFLDDTVDGIPNSESLELRARSSGQEDSGTVRVIQVRQ